MAGPLVPPIETDRITCQKSAHEWGKQCLPGAKQKVEVISHQRPGKTFGTGFDEEFREALKKLQAIMVVEEDVPAVHSANDDVLEKIRKVKTCGPWHVKQRP
jgi:hypothetical protein